ncbi:hypothetical protein L7849_019900, partial [Providencia rettgeri]
LYNETLNIDVGKDKINERKTYKNNNLTSSRMAGVILNIIWGFKDGYIKINIRIHERIIEPTSAVLKILSAITILFSL